MKRLTRSVACVLCITISVGIYANDVPTGTWASGYVSGNNYRELSVNEQTTYVVGVLDGLLLAPSFTPGDGPGWISACVSTGILSDQAHAIVDKYLRDHPENWNTPMPFLVYKAFEGACTVKGYGPRKHPESAPQSQGPRAHD